MNLTLSTEFSEKAVRRLMEWLITAGPTIMIILLVVYGLQRLSVILLNRLREFLVKRHAQDQGASMLEVERRMNTLISIVKRLIKVALWMLATVLILREFGVDIAPIIAGAGILGLAVGFGAQNLVRDIISGFFMILENHVRVGDTVTINNQTGIVESVRLRNILLRDTNGAIHIFANGQITQLSNSSKGWSATLINLLVDYMQNADMVMDIMRDVAKGLKETKEFGDLMIQDLELFGVDKFTDGGILIKARIKTLPNEESVVGREYNRRLQMALLKAGVKLARPATYTA